MRRWGRVALASLAATLCGWPVATPASAQQPPTGLISATAEELRGVPLASVPYSGTDLPPQADLSASLPPPGNQGNQNSCVGWTLAYALKSYQEVVESGTSYVGDDGQVRADRVFSPAFLYNQANNGRDGGVSFLDALRLLEERGAATWADMPYVDSDYRTQPSAEVRARATRYRIDYWQQVNTQSIKSVKAHVNGGFPVIIGANVDEGFWQARRGHIWRSTQGRVLGPHAMLVVGYDDSRAAFKVINSWGQGWGDGGYGWIGYDHFLHAATEAFVAKDAVSGDSVVVDRPAPQPQPQPAPRDPGAGIAFAVTAVNNAQWPDRPDIGPLLRFDGSLLIPPGAGRSNQSVIHFYYDDGAGGKGAPVRGNMSEYMDINGNAACGTAVYPIPAEGTRTTWGAWIPYRALEVPAGGWVNTTQGQQYQPRVTHLVAEPILFIDNFGVFSGGLFRFQVQR